MTSHAKDIDSATLALFDRLADLEPATRAAAALRLTEQMRAAKPTDGALLCATCVCGTRGRVWKGNARRTAHAHSGRSHCVANEVEKKKKKKKENKKETKLLTRLATQRCWLTPKRDWHAAWRPTTLRPARALPQCWPNWSACAATRRRAGALLSQRCRRTRRRWARPDRAQWRWARFLASARWFGAGAECCSAVSQRFD